MDPNSVSEILSYFRYLPVLLYIIVGGVRCGECYYHLIYSLTAGKTYKKDVKSICVSIELLKYTLYLLVSPRSTKISQPYNKIWMGTNAEMNQETNKETKEEMDKQTKKQTNKQRNKETKKQMNK